MIPPFELSSVALCAVISLETWALLSLLRDVLFLTRFQTHRRPVALEESLEQVLGKQVPEFHLREVDSQASVTEEDIRGRFSIFLFITRDEVTEAGNDVFGAMVHGLLGHADDCLYIACEGSDADGRWIRDYARLAERYGGRVRVLIARSATMRMQLGISLTPSSVMIDEEGKVVKIGRPIAGDAGVTLEERHAA